MIKNLRLLFTILGAVVLTAAYAPAVQPEYIGSITNGLFAPTSLKIGDDQLAVLEPYAGQISIYAPNGQVRHKIDIAGDVSGLERISNNIYAFCDRSRKDVIAIDITTGAQYSLAGSWVPLNDPVDIETGYFEYYFLDAGSKEIIISNSLTHQTRRIALQKENGERMRSPSSFDYNKSARAFFVFDQVMSKVWVFSYSGRYISQFGSFGGSDGQISRGGELSSDPDGNIYIVDRYQGRIAVFSLDGEFIENINLAELGLASHTLPSGIDIDDQGFLYVSSSEGKTIDIIYVNPESSPRRVISALGVYPSDNDTVKTTGLELLAIIESNPLSFTITGFDFQLFADGDTTEPIAESIKTAPESEPVENSVERSIVSKWMIESHIDDESVYMWRVRAVSGDIIGGWSPLRSFYTSSLPTVFSLRQNYPNPFNPVTHIIFETPVQTNAALTIYNALGQKVKSYDFRQLAPGKHDITWDGTDYNGNDLSSGIYFYRLTTTTFSKTRKMALLK